MRAHGRALAEAPIGAGWVWMRPWLRGMRGLVARWRSAAARRRLPEAIRVHGRRAICAIGGRVYAGLLSVMTRSGREPPRELHVGRELLHRERALKLVVFGLTVSSSWGNGHATLWRGLCGALARRGNEVVFFERDVP